MVLEEPGYSVREAANGNQALGVIKTTHVDLIVLDLYMPDTDGFEFLNAVRAEPPKFKMIATSGFWNETMLSVARMFGATATLTKPFSPDSLLSVVRKLLAGERSNGALDSWRSVMKARHWTFVPTSVVAATVAGDGLDQADVNVHDLRRSAHYQMLKARIDSKTRRSIMGHKSAARDDRQTTIDDGALADAVGSRDEYQRNQSMTAATSDLQRRLDSLSGEDWHRIAADRDSQVTGEDAASQVHSPDFRYPRRYPEQDRPPFPGWPIFC